MSWKWRNVTFDFFVTFSFADIIEYVLCSQIVMHSLKTENNQNVFNKTIKFSDFAKFICHLKVCMQILYYYVNNINFPVCFHIIKFKNEQRWFFWADHIIHLWF